MSPRQPSLRLILVFAAALLSVAACEKAPESQVVTVYSSRSHYGAESVFVAFTRATGIAVEFFDGNNSEVLERLKAEGERTNADLLLTVDAGNLWNAAQQGLLQPIQSAVLAANIPARLRDPENQWFAVATRARTIMYNPARVNPSELSTYEQLGDPKWKGRLCLRTSSAVYNQSLLASLISIHGEEATERIVRGWVANEPIYINGDTQILEAVAAGRCDVAITNHYYLARLLAKNPQLSVALFWADQQGAGVHVNISGGGVTRHARNRGNAIRLLEYLSTPEAQALLASSSFEFPANPSVPPHEILARFGGFRPQSVGVAAAGAFQAAAVRLADRAGYR
ncbi:MAG: extracellular solute-binding protein [Gemmatimonadaceae bacterium]